MILFSSSSALLWNTSFRSFSRPIILFSSSSALLWKTFLARSESSAAVPALSSLATAATIFSSVFSRSSSRPDTRLVRAFISRGRGGNYDEDDEGHGHHGPGVQCASQ